MEPSSQPMIQLDRLTKTYGPTVAVDHLSLEVATGELCVLVGPSGCGKTTTMKMINRVIEPSGGRILLAGEDVTDVDPVELRRRIGYVIQQIGLFPHKTVEANVGIVPGLLGWDRKRVKARSAELLELVGLDPDLYLKRYPHELSGGQRQRVGVARALAADPPVLLMDEPFGAVDPIARGRLQGEFLRLQEQVRKTIIFVTHDIAEAVRLGDRIAVLRQGGVLEQYDDPATILGSPANDFVADFVGSDRGLIRLAVTPIEVDDLDQPPVVRMTDTLATAGDRLASTGTRWAVVLDDRGTLHGWLAAEEAQGPGTVASRAHRMEAWVPVTASLREAFSVMLQENAGWVAVEDNDKFLGVLTPTSLHAALRRSIEDEPVLAAGAV